jgi:hypothetical protein
MFEAKNKNKIKFPGWTAEMIETIDETLDITMQPLINTLNE